MCDRCLNAGWFEKKVVAPVGIFIIGAIFWTYAALAVVSIGFWLSFAVYFVWGLLP